MNNETQTNYLQCTNCKSKFKKVCPSDRICSISDKCAKCGSALVKMGNPYNSRKSAQH